MALQVTELVVGSCSDRSGRALQLVDFHFFGSSIFKRARQSKTDHHQKGVEITAGSYLEADIFQVVALQQHLAVRGLEVGPLFHHFVTSPLTKFQFGMVSRKALDTLGLGQFQFGTHSFWEWQPLWVIQPQPLNS